MKYCRRRTQRSLSALRVPSRSLRISFGESSFATGTHTASRQPIAKHREIQAVDPDALSDDELVAYLTKCRDHHAAMITQHMRYTAGAMIPTGDFLAHVGDWTDLSHAELLGLLRGAAPVSAGGSAELERLKTIADDAAAMKLLDSGDDPAQVLAALRDLGGDTGPAVAGYLD